nr:hypothetical protein CPGR_00943 [Mycolicibacter nonchromogenicus]
MSHGTGAIPNQPSMMLSSPLSVLNTNCHTTAITTEDTANGIKAIARNRPIPLILRFSRPATARLMSTVGTTVPTVNTVVLRTAMPNNGLPVNRSR